MADRASIYTDLERKAAIAAVQRVRRHFTTTECAEVVDAGFRAIGMKRQAAPTFAPMSSAPKEGDVILRTPTGAEIRAVWWASWADPDDPHPWAWRVARGDGTVGEPIPAADGWRAV